MADCNAWFCLTGREVMKQLNKRTASAAKKRLEKQRRVLKHAQSEAGPIAIHRRKTEETMQEYENYV